MKSFDQFWVDIRSVEVQVRGIGAALVKAQIPDRVYDNCGVTDGCFGLPLNCIASRKCDLVLGYHEDPGYGQVYGSPRLGIHKKDRSGACLAVKVPECTEVDLYVPGIRSKW